MDHLGKENCPPTTIFSTPPRKSPSEGNCVENTFMESPVMVKVIFDDVISASDDELFASHGPFTKYDDNDITTDDENVFFFLRNENEEGGEKKRSSYSGVRGPKADAKALSLVTNCPVSVKWLLDNFEYYPKRSLPRGFVYEEYVSLCNTNALEPVNAASFGKLIRSVFPGLKTRRLGTRGNSKYHYNGVYLKPSSHLMAVFNLIKSQQGLNYEGNGKRGRKVRRRSVNNDLLRNADEFMECPPEVKCQV
jgi:hypothetical protein